jgi:hypothetical protein
MSFLAEAACLLRRSAVTLLKIRICNTSKMLSSLTSNTLSYLRGHYILIRNHKGRISWCKIVRMMTMRMGILLSNLTVRIASLGLHPTLMIMRIINLKV